MPGVEFLRGSSLWEVLIAPPAPAPVTARWSLFCWVVLGGTGSCILPSEHGLRGLLVYMLPAVHLACCYICVCGLLAVCLQCAYELNLRLMQTEIDQ